MREGLPLFVYGTLKAGEAQGPLLGASRRQKAWTRGALYALPAGYPALVPGAEGRVEGELVDPIDDRLLALLDTYEGVGEGLFDRVRLDVFVGLRGHQAWGWTLAPSQARIGRRIPDGRWRSARRR